ncbi:MAG: hypothetical protein U1B79_00820 [Candidatus Pacearchaeota archaeon]|nr:hypothetical protein [Candidatus Pacearchaeota archaeon]
MNYDISQEDWTIVEARLETMPEEMTIGILSSILTKRQLIKEVNDRSEIGIAYASMQLRFIRWLLQESKIV